MLLYLTKDPLLSANLPILKAKDAKKQLTSEKHHDKKTNAGGESKS